MSADDAVAAVIDDLELTIINLDSISEQYVSWQLCIMESNNMILVYDIITVGGNTLLCCRTGLHHQ